jgi:hypothetical protein
MLLLEDWYAMASSLDEDRFELKHHLERRCRSELGKLKSEIHQTTDS